jgi:hypothetical protein
MHLIKVSFTYCYACGSMNIVFVHFGPTLPKHLCLNLIQTAETMDSHQVFLISDSRHLDLPTAVRNFIVTDQPYIDHAKVGLSHPTDFRENFWFLALKRFLVFNLFMKEHPGSLIHFESDVIISPDFPFKEFSHLDTPFAFPFISQSLGIPSILYLKDRTAADLLCEFSLQCINQDAETTDMKILTRLQKDYPESITVLPSGPVDINFYVEGTSNDFANSQAAGLSKFKGIFDGAAIGQFLLGDDPRNNRGFRNIYFESGYSSLCAKKLGYEFSTSRKFIDILIDSERIPLFAIHVHSKDSRVFSPNEFFSVIQNRIKNNLGRPEKEFLFYVAFSQASKALKRRFTRFLRAVKNG